MSFRRCSLCRGLANEAGINGPGVLQSARKVASDHLKDAADPESAIESMINRRITGVGGIAVMPITIPAGLLASYALGANTAASIAYVRGYDIDTEQVRTLILLRLIGESAEQALKNAGIAIGTKLTKAVLQQIPGRIFIEINKRAGFRLITKAGENGVINVAKWRPGLAALLALDLMDTLLTVAGGLRKLFSRPSSLPMHNEGFAGKGNKTEDSVSSKHRSMIIATEWQDGARL